MNPVLLKPQSNPQQMRKGLSIMSDTSAIERMAVEMAAMRRDIANLARLKGERLTRAEVCERLGIHRNTLRTYIDERAFPRPCRDGKWLLAEVIEWESGK